MIDPTATNSTGRIAAVAAVLFVVALGLRFVGIDQGLPHRGEPDTYIVQQAERLLLEGPGDRYRAGWKYPHLVATVVAAVPAEEIARPPEGATLAEHLQVATALHLRTRKVAAFLSALVAPATFLIALRFFPLAWAAVSGLLVASSLLHICFSVQARPHGPVSALAALALLGALRWAERPTLGRALCLGVLAAGAVGSLHTGLAVLAPITVAAITLFRRVSGERRPIDRRKVAVGLLLVGALITVSVGWFYVRADDGFGKDPSKSAAATALRQGGLGSAELDERAQTGRDVETQHEGRSILRFSGHVIPLDLFDGRGFGVAWRTLRAYDPLLLAFALIGIVGLAAALARSRLSRPGTDLWIVLGFALPTLLLYGLYAKSTDRFLLILVPMVALAAGNGLRLVAARVPRAGRLLAAAATVAVVAGAVRTAQLRGRPDTATEAARWLVENVERESQVHLTNLRSIPLFMQAAQGTRDFIWSNGPWEAYQWALLHPRSRRVRGERAAPDEPTTDGAQRYGRWLAYATVADQYRVMLGPDHAMVARDVLESADPGHALVVVNPSTRAGPVDQAVLARAWRTPLQDERWELVHRIESGLSDDERALGYVLDFRAVFRARALGPTIEIHARRSD